VYVCLSVCLSICSSAVTQHVISALLTKFNITDNAMKFALYERTFDDSRQQLGNAHSVTHFLLIFYSLTYLKFITRVLLLVSG